MVKTKKITLVIASLFTGIAINAQVINSWADKIGSTLSDDSRAIAQDLNGNIYIAGSFQGTTDFDPSPSVYTVTSGGGDDAFISKYDANGNFLSVYTFSNNLYCKIFGLVVDNNNDVIVTGGYSGTVDFDPGVGTSIHTAGASGTNIFIMKLNANGTHAWSKNIGAVGLDDYGLSVTSDQNNNVLITGYFQGSNVDFDPGSGVFNMGAVSTNKQIFLLKLDAAGNFVWAFPIDSPSSDVGQTVATDALNNVYIGGYFSNICDFNPSSTATNSLQPSGSWDAFIAKYDANGNYIWANPFTGASTENVLFIKVSNATGDVYSTGNFKGVVDFDPATSTFTLASVGTNDDIFISKLNSSGNFVWAKSIGNSGVDFGISISVNNSELYLTGYFENTVDFDPSPSSFSLTSNGLADVYVADFDLNGNLLTAFNMGGSGNDYGRGIITSTNAIICTGTFSNTCDFYPGTPTNSLVSTGSDDVFISKYSSLPTQIKESNKLSSLSIFPNPCFNSFTIKNNHPSNYKLYNVIGAEVMTINTTELSETVDVSQLNAGIYFLKGNTVLSKIIITK